MGLHPAHGTAGHSKGFGVAVIKLIMVAAQFFPGSGRAAHSLAQKSRVCNEAPAHHDARQSRKCRFQCPQVIRGGHIAVVADRSSAGGQVGSKGFPVGLTAVELFHHPGVDGQLAEGVFVVNVQDLPELLRPDHTQPGLDRHRPACLRKDSVQKGIQLLRVPEHSGTLALGCHGTGGTLSQSLPACRNLLFGFSTRCNAPCKCKVRFFSKKYNHTELFIERLILSVIIAINSLFVGLPLSD